LKKNRKDLRFKKHYIRRILLFILGGLLIFYGFFLIFTSSESNGDTIAFGGGGTTSGIVTNMFAPILILFGIIWILALCLKPLNKVVVNIFKPYLRRTKLLTENNILRHRKRTALTFIMITLTTSFLIGISTMMASISAGIDTTIDEFMGANIRIYTYGTPRSFETDLLNYSGVDNVMGVSHQNARFLIDGDWIGHGYLESGYTESISVNIIDTKRIKEEMRDTIIISPSTMTIDDIMDDIESGDKIIITEDFANDYNVKAGDVIPVNFTLGVTFENAERLIDQDLTNAREEAFLVNMTVSAIIKDLKGFSTRDLLSLGSGVKQYHSFVSWTTYEKIAIHSLPSGTTDLIIRQKANTGDNATDNFLPNWFNFSQVETILNGTNGIEYYTTRMDYFTAAASVSLFPTVSVIPLSSTSVVGIHTNSYENIKSDDYFGDNTIVGENTTIEELLNTTDNVCVVDERALEGTGLTNGSSITIIPTTFNRIPIFVDSSNSIINMGNYSSYTGSVDDLALSDNTYLSFASNQSSLAFNITTTLEGAPFTHLNRPSIITIETSLNETVDNLRLEIFNILTNSFDTLGYINNTEELNHTFVVDQTQFYASMGFLSDSHVILRVVGMNSTYNGSYNFSIDSLSIINLQSNKTVDLFPEFTIVGIVEEPTYYNTEKYSWYAGSEGYYDVTMDVPIYINYDKAREEVYPEYSGTDISNDNVTHVLVHCNNVENITAVKNQLLTNLSELDGPEWTILDPKNQTLQNRLNVFDWFVWIESGASDEAILDGMLAYIEDEGYIVIFSFTTTFMQSTFNTMINLITFLTNALLIFCIVIAMIGLVLHSLLTTMARRREIGMLRSIGLSRQGVIRSISGETYVLSILGLSSGIIAGIYLGWLMVETIPGGGFLAVTFTIPWITVILLVAAVVSTVILSSRFPARWAARLNIIDAVRTR